MAKLRAVCRLTNGLCWYCGLPAQTRDHIIPVAKGGLSTPWNLVPACRYCNSMKGEQSLEEFREYIRDWRTRRPNSPKQNAILIADRAFKFWFEIQGLKPLDPPVQLPPAGAYQPNAQIPESLPPADSIPATPSGCFLQSNV